MARHPESRHLRALYGAPGQVRERPVDRNGHARGFVSIEKRAVKRAEDGSIGFKGHAAMFDSRTLIGSKRWGFYEEIAPGAFRKTIGEADVRFLFNHDPSFILARNKAGTMRLAEDDQGLAVDADMGPYSWAGDVAVGLDRGDLTQMSFAFDPIKWERSADDDGIPVYRLTEVRLWDVSVVTYPAYEDTDAGLRDDETIEAAAQRLADAMRAGTLQRAELERLLSWAPATVSTDSEPGSSTRTDDPPAQSTDVDINRSHDELRHRMLAELIH
jgi:uncharacterized protein